MTSKIREIGLTVVHQPDDSQHELDIVFVHGLFGHPERTWSCKSNADPVQKVYWPRDLLPLICPQARVMTWGYDVKIERVFSSTSQSTIFNHSHSLLHDVAGCRRRNDAKSKPIVFIAHSLGGIVVKDALAISRNDRTFVNEILPATLGVIFLGTPHRGSRVASLATVVLQMTRVLWQKPNTKVLAGLQPNSEILDRIASDFGNILVLGKLRVHSFMEELDTKGVRIVDGSSSTINYPGETTSTIRANHTDIAAFSALDDVGLERIQAVLDRWWTDHIGGQKYGRNVGLMLKNPLFHDSYSKCLGSLDFPDLGARLENIQPPYPNTHDWIFGEEVGFSAWLKGEVTNPKFWITGKPGSGKSTAMKFAMNHPSLREKLMAYAQGDWIIVGHFFHDRGSSMQKSPEGFLREIIFEILKQSKDSFPVIYQAYVEAHDIGFGVPDFQVPWSFKALQKALEALAQKPGYFKLCLFVDALDEHNGDHRSLLHVLDNICHIPEDTMLRIRLCLASRSENIFRDAFRSCPQITIHEHTKRDIDVYVRGRIEPEISGRYTETGTAEFGDLVDAIVEKTRGVFLWVRLVVDELVDGLVEGDTVEESKDLLRTIPTELSALFTRAVSRIGQAPGGGTAVSETRVDKVRLEAYIMFQISACSIKPLELTEFLRVAAHTAETHGLVSSQIHELKSGQQHSRLNARSAGLLETFSFRDGKAVCVQFIHQTVKAYFSSGQYAQLIAPRFENIRHLSGTSMILMSLISPGPFRPAFQRPCVYQAVPVFLQGRNFARSQQRSIGRYMQKLEMSEGVCIGDHLECPPSNFRLQTGSVIPHDLSKPYAKLVDLDVKTIVVDCSNESGVTVLCPSSLLPKDLMNIIKEGRYDAFLEQLWANLLRELWQLMSIRDSSYESYREEDKRSYWQILRNLKARFSNETLKILEKEFLEKEFDMFVASSSHNIEEALINQWNQLEAPYNVFESAAGQEPPFSLPDLFGDEPSGSSDAESEKVWHPPTRWNRRTLKQRFSSA